MSTTMPVTHPTGLYAEVQMFYARQVHWLDTVQPERFASTFARDAVFDHTPDSPPLHGRAAIEEELRTYHERRFGADPVMRRHWFNMLDVREHADATIHTRYYAPTDSCMLRRQDPSARVMSSI